MTKFFPYKTNTNTAFDIARGALGNAKNALAGAPISAYLGSSVLATNSLATLVGACALGGAILIVPAMIAHKQLGLNPTGTLTLGLKPLFAFASACIGAALCGLAVLAVAKAALIGSLTFLLIIQLTNAMNRSEQRLSPTHGIASTLDDEEIEIMREDSYRAIGIAF